MSDHARQVSTDLMSGKHDEDMPALPPTQIDKRGTFRHNRLPSYDANGIRSRRLGRD